ncbi:MAG: hypothetical protein DMG67_10815 [Acidobacteria bacterium]|nr:MAG: hypothetical protein DMG67_10815 [Acidobacteriota bacterium]
MKLARKKSVDRKLVGKKAAPAGKKLAGKKLSRRSSAEQVRERPAERVRKKSAAQKRPAEKLTAPAAITSSAGGQQPYVHKISKEQDEPHLSMPVPAGRAAREAAGAAEEGGCYVYGIIAGDGQLPLGKSGIGGEIADVFSVDYSGLVAVCSRVRMAILDATRENALAHEHVVERVMNTHTIIPMSFGTVFRTEEDIREVLKSIYPSLRDVLEKMQGKIEFGLKVTWDRDKMIEKLKREDEEIRQFVQELAKKHLQSTYFARMQLGRMIDRALTERSVDIVKEIYDSLRPACVASRDNKTIGENMIMNAAFLLQRKKEPEFDRIVNQISERFKNILSFRYSGPWPPYNFVNIRLKLEGAS